ncbi:hypothetical protein PYE51_11655 [Vibrio aestuarianus]|uniref:Uncharacterized protein n=1 Tax=Vibrio aestuarianus TaxID=28171 RepID=A0AAX3U1B1_9VIBR|nr:hypothetical protein [Vibrio aestuarianus]WGK81280.1 hypothetical protein PYE51_11655 [Vibrio aestuarianus]
MKKTGVVDKLPEGFDLELYRKYNRDLSLFEDDELKRHFLMHGRKEARLYREVDTALEDIVAYYHSEMNMNDVCNIVNEHHEVQCIKENLSEIFSFQFDDELSESIISIMFFRHWSVFSKTKFNSEMYLLQNPDVAEADCHPFYHYWVAGREEGRLLYPLHDTDILTRNSILDAGKYIGTVDSLDFLEQEIETKNRSFDVEEKVSRVILSISHDDPLKCCGGVQSCIQRELEIIEDDIEYISVFPLKAYTAFDYGASLVGLRSNKQGVFITTYLELIEAVKKSDKPKSILLHTMQGHNPNYLLDLLEISNEKVCWVHDYFILCESYKLLRNDYKDCSYKKSSAMCKFCVYKDTKSTHAQHMKSILPLIDAFIFPSESAKNVVLADFELKDIISTKRLRVVPHIEMEFEGVESVCKESINLGFIGYSAPQKGHPLFLDLAQNFEFNNVNFLQFTSSDVNYGNVTTIYSSVEKDNRDAMIKSLRANHTDIVLILSTWQETFCLAAYEALIAGCEVWTLESSGNVSNLVSSEFKDAVKVFSDINEIAEKLTLMDSKKEFTLAGVTLNYSHSSMSLSVLKELF